MRKQCGACHDYTDYVKELFYQGDTVGVCASCEMDITRRNLENNVIEDFDTVFDPGGCDFMPTSEATISAAVYASLNNRLTIKEGYDILEKYGYLKAYK